MVIVTEVQPPRPLGRMVELGVSGYEGRMQGCRGCRRAQPLYRITTPASSALADGCEHRYAVYSNLSRYLRDYVSTCASRDVYICRLPSCLSPTAHLKGDRSSKLKATCKQS